MLQLGQVLKGRLSSYKLTRQLQDSVWLAVNQQVNQNVIVKHVDHFRIGLERDALVRFQGRTQHIRPLLDEIEIENEGKWPALVLRWLDDDVLRTSIKRQLSRAELKRVGLGILKALEVLHEDGFVHTDIKPSNVLVNYSQESDQISDVQLADFESTVHEDSDYAKDGDDIGSALFRSTEALLEMRWGRPTDIWSFGATMITLIYGGNFHIFKPDVDKGHDDYDTKILLRHNELFGPFPSSYKEIADADRQLIVQWVLDNTSDSYTPFENVFTDEVPEQDKRFLLKIMKLDPRDRPTVQELLADEWFMSDIPGNDTSDLETCDTEKKEI